MIDAHGRPGRVLLLGGTSQLGLAILDALPLAPDAEVVLAGRDLERMREVGATLAYHVTTMAYDATAPQSHEALVASVVDGGDIDLVISAAGILTPQNRLDLHPDEAAALIDTNFTGHAVTLIAAAAALRRQGSGTLVVLSSIAAVRPRRSNTCTARPRPASTPSPAALPTR